MGIIKNGTQFRVYCWGRKSPDTGSGKSKGGKRLSRVSKLSRLWFRPRVSETTVGPFAESQKDFVYYTKPTLTIADGYNEFRRK